MELHDLYPFPEERKNRKRIGRGSGSGSGGTAGKGHKGQNARSGGGVRPGFEGGQMPIQRRLPKHGFSNYRFKAEYAVINLDRLATAFEDKSEISLQDIYDCGLAKSGVSVKILGDGEISKAIKIEAHKFSVSAKAKIERAGGSATALEAEKA